MKWIKKYNESIEGYKEDALADIEDIILDISDQTHYDVSIRKGFGDNLEKENIFYIKYTGEGQEGIYKLGHGLEEETIDSIIRICDYLESNGYKFLFIFNNYIMDTNKTSIYEDLKKTKMSKQNYIAIRTNLSQKRINKDELD